MIVFFAYNIWHLSTSDGDFISEAVTSVPEYFSNLIGSPEKKENKKNAFKANKISDPIKPNLSESEVKGTIDRNSNLDEKILIDEKNTKEGVKIKKNIDERSWFHEWNEKERWAAQQALNSALDILDEYHY